MNQPPRHGHPGRRAFVRNTGVLALAAVAAPALVRAQSKVIVVRCAGTHASWMEKLVLPHMKAKLGATILFEGTKSSVNLEKMSSNKDKPYLSVVQMDDPVMIQAVEAGLLTPITTATAPNLAQLRKGAVHMDGMWANYVQPWAGVAYNTKALPGVASWAELWDAKAKGKVIIPSLQNTEGMWTLFMAAHLATGKPMAQAQFEIDAAFDKLKALKPNVINVYAVMSQAFNLLEQGEISLLAGNDRFGEVRHLGTLGERQHGLGHVDSALMVVDHELEEENLRFEAPRLAQLVELLVGCHAWHVVI